MRIEEKFNKRTANIIEVQPATLFTGQGNSALGIKCTFFTLPGSDDPRTLSMHFTPIEALQFAESLVSAARQELRKALNEE